jgi:hypothetical protein
VSLKAVFDDGSGTSDRMGWDASVATIVEHLVHRLLEAYRRLAGARDVAPECESTRSGDDSPGRW